MMYLGIIKCKVRFVKYVIFKKKILLEKESKKDEGFELNFIFWD